jgi:hypothetical protein
MPDELKKPFWKWVFSEADGTPSFSRVATGLTLCFALGWVTAIVMKHYALPDFAGLAMFVGTLYGLNRLGAAITPKPPEAPKP